MADQTKPPMDQRPDRAQAQPHGAALRRYVSCTNAGPALACVSCVQVVLMIVSSRGKFVFYHNPKVAGASVHKSLETYHDGPIPGWGMGSDGRELAHYGIDEFAQIFPEEWARISGWKMYSLYRDSYDRFMSSFVQYSRKHGDVDVRFAPPAQSKDYLFKIIEELEGFGRAEGVMETHRFDLFRPQWIYLTSENHQIDLSIYHISDVEQIYQSIEERTGDTIERMRINERERLDLPGPLSRLLAHGKFARRIGQLPGAEGAKTWLKQTFKSNDKTSGVQLDPQETTRVRDFIAQFYERDAAFFADREALVH